MESVPMTYQDLDEMPNAQARGYAFERYVADLLRQEHFAVSQSQDQPTTGRSTCSLEIGRAHV